MFLRQSVSTNNIYKEIPVLECENANITVRADVFGDRNIFYSEAIARFARSRI